VIEVMPLRPDCPSKGNPVSLVSLLDMLRFQGSSFVRASSLIAQLHSQVRHGVTPTRGSWDMVFSSLKDIRIECRILGLDATLAQIDRVENIVGSDSINVDILANAIMEVNSRMTDELDARHLYGVDSVRAAYISSNQFSRMVGERFPDAIADMDEAARCYAFERPTACIYHLMRVTEYGIKGVADLLGIADHNPSWEPIIRKIDAELKADYENRHFKGNQDFLANASTHLHAVKVAWRNKAMHVEKINTMEHAKEIYDATCGFMRYVAENLPSQKPGIIQSIRGALGV